MVNKALVERIGVACYSHFETWIQYEKASRTTYEDSLQLSKSVEILKITS